MNEGAIVYASFLLDQGDPEAAWKVDRSGFDHREAERGASAAVLRRRDGSRAALGDRASAKAFSDAIVLNDPSFPGWDSLEAEIARLPD